MTVGIALAVHNGERFLKPLLDSLLNQSFKDFRVYVGDDASNDSTPMIIKQYGLKHPNKFIYHLNERKSTPKDNFWSIIERIEEPYIMTCDQDDVWLRDKIELTLSLAKKTEKQFPGYPVLVHTDLKVTDENLKILSDSMFKRQKLSKNKLDFNRILVQNNVTGCTVMFNRELKRYLNRKPKFMIMHDWWMALVATAFGEVSFLDKPTILYRQHSENNVGAVDMSNPNFIIKRALQVKQVKKSIDATYAQAESFLDEFRDILSDDRVKVLNRYLSIKNLNKFKRMNALRQGKFYQYGLVKRIGQFLYI